MAISYQQCFGSLVWVLFLISAIPAWAGDLTIVGTALDPSDASIADAIVELSGPSGSQHTRTDTDGSFSFTSLSPGAYNIKLSAAEFEPIDKTFHLQESRTDLMFRLGLERQSQ